MLGLPIALASMRIVLEKMDWGKNLLADKLSFIRSGHVKFLETIAIVTKCDVLDLEN